MNCWAALCSGASASLGTELSIGLSRSTTLPPGDGGGAAWVEELQGVPFHLSQGCFLCSPLGSLQGGFGDALWLEALSSGQVKHPGTQVPHKAEWQLGVCVCLMTLASSCRSLQHRHWYVWGQGLPAMSPTACQHCRILWPFCSVWSS